VLANQESINSLSLVDLLIQERRPAVVEALLELATAAQQEVACEPDNADLQNYAYSLAWHYVRLRDCEKIDDFIAELITKKEQAERLASIATSLPSRFDCAMAEVDGLQRFVKWQPGRMRVPLWREPPRDALMRGELSPVTVASLPRTAPDIGLTEVLDGVTKLLGRAPWVLRNGLSIFEEYYADPGQRLEFQAACKALLPKIEDLKRSAKKVVSLDKVMADAAAARTKVEVEWNKARENQKLPLTLGNLAKEVIDRQRAPVI
jgi:hypothetical protein